MDLKATFPLSIPPVIVAAPYQINSRITLADVLPAGTKVTIVRDGTTIVSNWQPTTVGPFWITDLIAGAVPADFDAGYGEAVENYVITISGPTANPLVFTTTAFVESVIDKDGFDTGAETVLDDITLGVTVPPDEAAALAWLQANTFLTSSSMTIVDLKATFPLSIPPVIVAAPYKINSRMTLSGDAIPAGSTVSIWLTVNGGTSFLYADHKLIPASPFWVTRTGGGTPANFDDVYGGRTELYAITINSAGGNPLALNGHVLIESIISRTTSQPQWCWMTSRWISPSRQRWR